MLRRFLILGTLVLGSLMVTAGQAEIGRAHV